MKNKFRALFSAISMLLVSTMMLATSTYAWFSMNNVVRVTGMQIQAVNESGYLIIGTKEKTATEDPTVESLRAANLTEVDLSGQYAITSVRACAHKSLASTNKISDIDTKSEGAYTMWFTKVAASPSSYAAADDAPETKLTSYDSFVLFYDLYITVATGSAEMANLKASVSITETGTSQEVREAVRVVVASDSACEEFYNAHTEGTTQVDKHSDGDIVLAQSLKSSDTAPIHIRVYMYIDGEDASVYTNNILNLSSATVQIALSAEPVSN